MDGTKNTPATMNPPGSEGSIWELACQRNEEELAANMQQETYSTWEERAEPEENSQQRPYQDPASTPWPPPWSKATDAQDNREVTGAADRAAELEEIPSLEQQWKSFTTGCALARSQGRPEPTPWHNENDWEQAHGSWDNWRSSQSEDNQNRSSSSQQVWTSGYEANRAVRHSWSDHTRWQPYSPHQEHIENSRSGWIDYDRDSATGWHS